MVDFTMQVAGCVIRVCAGFESTKHFCAEYLCQAEADFAVTVTADDICRERQISARQGQPEGISPEDIPEAYLEVLALHRNIAERLFDFDALMFHGSVVAVDGAGYLFAAPSGTGKSTHTRLWRQLLGEKAVMINDDKPMLRMAEGQVLAYGTPWNGKHRLSTNTSVPLRAICILERCEENSICQIPVKDALVSLLQQSNRPMDSKKMPKYMEILDKLAQGVRFYRLKCNMDPEAAQIAYDAMVARKEEHT